MTEFTTLKTKKARIQYIKEHLASDARWAIRGLTKIYDYQTADEQNSESTKYENGVGFSGADAEILSSFAKQVNIGRKLSAKQMAIVFKKMPKYARQLEGVSTPKQEAADLTEQMRDPNEEERRV